MNNNQDSVHLETLIEEAIRVQWLFDEGTSAYSHESRPSGIVEDGYLHCFVSNSGVEPVSFDNFKVTYLRGKTRQINHYYPYIRPWWKL